MRPMERRLLGPAAAAGASAALVPSFAAQAGAGSLVCALAVLAQRYRRLQPDAVMHAAHKHILDDPGLLALLNGQPSTRSTLTQRLSCGSVHASFASSSSLLCQLTRPSSLPQIHLVWALHGRERSALACARASRFFEHVYLHELFLDIPSSPPPSQRLSDQLHAKRSAHALLHSSHRVYLCGSSTSQHEALSNGSAGSPLAPSLEEMRAQLAQQLILSHELRSHSATHRWRLETRKRAHRFLERLDQLQHRATAFYVSASGVLKRYSRKLSNALSLSHRYSHL